MSKKKVKNSEAWGKLKQEAEEATGTIDGEPIQQEESLTTIPDTKVEAVLNKAPTWKDRVNDRNNSLFNHKFVTDRVKEQILAIEQDENQVKGDEYWSLIDRLIRYAALEGKSLDDALKAGYIDIEDTNDDRILQVEMKIIPNREEEDNDR